MTLDEFMVALGQAAPSYTWNIHWLGQIVAKTTDSCMCPITVLADYRKMEARVGSIPLTKSRWNVTAYAQALELSTEDLDIIVAAADDIVGNHHYKPEIRRRLLEITGLRHQKESV